MSLLTLIQKDWIQKVANATPATIATEEAKKGKTVAEVAAVAVAGRHKDAFEAQLLAHGISIAVDRATGSAILLFKPSDADIVRHVADIYQPFEAGKLTRAQRMEILDSLNYYERLLKRKAQK